MEKRYRTVGK